MTRRHLRLVLSALCVLAPALASAQDEPPPVSERPLSIAPGGYVQFDMRTFPDWGVASGTGRLDRAALEVRRIRAELEGAWRRFDFELSVDPQDTDGALVKDAYLQIRLGTVVRIRGGQFKVPGSREYDVSARDLDFLERSMLAADLAPGRDAGVQVELRPSGRFRYQAGVFAGDGADRDDRAGLTTAGRVTWDGPRDLAAGVYVTAGQTEANDTGAPNGIDVESGSGYRFLDGPYVDGLRLRVGGEMEWSPGRWRMVADLLRVRDERRAQGLDFEDLPALTGTAISVSLHRRLNARLWRLPAIDDVSIRYERAGFDDNGPDTDRDSVRPRATDVRALAVQTVTTGGSWRVAPWARVLGNVGIDWFSDARSAPDPTRSGPYVSLGARLQIELP